MMDDDTIRAINSPTMRCQEVMYAMVAAPAPPQELIAATTCASSTSPATLREKHRRRSRSMDADMCDGLVSVVRSDSRGRFATAAGTLEPTSVAADDGADEGDEVVAEHDASGTQRQMERSDGRQRGPLGREPEAGVPSVWPTGREPRGCAVGCAVGWGGNRLAPCDGPVAPCWAPSCSPPCSAPCPPCPSVAIGMMSPTDDVASRLTTNATTSTR